MLFSGPDNPQNCPPFRGDLYPVQYMVSWTHQTAFQSLSHFCTELRSVWGSWASCFALR